MRVFQVESEWGMDLATDSEGVQRLRRAVIEAKEQLSFIPSTPIELDYHGKRYRREINRELFDKLITPVIDHTLGPCRDCIPDGATLVLPRSCYLPWQFSRGICLLHPGVRSRSWLL